MVKPAPKKQDIEQNNQEFALPKEIEIKEVPQTGLSVRSAFRDSMELKIASKLDINVDHLHQAQLSDQRLKQIFKDANIMATKQKIGAPVFIACALTTILSFASLITVDEPGEAFNYIFGMFGGITGMAATGLGLLDSDLDTKVKQEIDQKTGQQPDSPKLPSPENK